MPLKNFSSVGGRLVHDDQRDLALHVDAGVVVPVVLGGVDAVADEDDGRVDVGGGPGRSGPWRRSACRRSRSTGWPSVRGHEGELGFVLDGVHGVERHLLEEGVVVAGGLTGLRERTGWRCTQRRAGRRACRGRGLRADRARESGRGRGSSRGRWKRPPCGRWMADRKRPELGRGRYCEARAKVSRATHAPRWGVIFFVALWAFITGDSKLESRCGVRGSSTAGFCDLPPIRQKEVEWMGHRGVVRSQRREDGHGSVIVRASSGASTLFAQDR